MSLQMIAKKAGMMSFFNKKGELISVTVLEMAPNVISQIKTLEKDSYKAIQLSSVSVSSSKKRRLGKPLIGHYETKNIAPKKFAQESRVESLDGFEIGQEFTVEYFKEDGLIDVTGISKGKGYQGVMKRYNDRGGRGSHGAGPTARHPGSTGNRTSPGRCLPGRHQAGHMGDEQVTVERLKVVHVDPAKNVLLVEGSVPGPVGARVSIRQARKMKK